MTRTWCLRITKEYAVLFFLFFVAWNHSLAQEIIKHFTVDDGLPSSEVYDAHQDVRGYVWLCTDRGVSRYNGYEFENFTTSDGLTSNTVFNVFEDVDHNLWFVCFNGTISIFSYKNQRFEPFIKNKELKEYLGPYNWINVINFKNDQVYLFPNKLNNSVDSTVNYSEAVFQFDPNKKKLSLLPKLLKPFIGDEINNRRYATLPIYSFDEGRRYSTIKLKNTRVSERIVRDALNQFQANLLEMIGYFGQFQIVANMDHFSIVDENKDTTRIDLEGSNFETDSEGNLWVTTVNNGVFLMKNTGIELFPQAEFLKKPEKITAIDSYDGKPFIGTSRTAIIRPNTGEVVYREDTAVIGARIKFFGRWGNKLSLHSNKALCVVDPVKNKDQFVLSKVADRNLTVFGRPYLSLDICNGIKFNFDAGSYYFQNNQEMLDFKRLRVLHAAVNDDHDLYFSSHSDVFKVINGEYKEPIRLTSQLNISAATVRRIICAKSSFVIYGTSGEGIIIAKDDLPMMKITKEQGLVSNTINSIYFDDQLNRLWCGTNNGISIIDFSAFDKKVKMKSIQNITRMDGLPSDFVVDLTRANDKIWVAFTKDVVSISREYSIRNIPPPKVNFISLIQNEMNVLFRKHTFNHDENDLRIRYSAYSQKKPVNGNFYRHRLIRFNIQKQKWRYTNDREISFMNLEPGSYRFEVSARAENGKWSNPRVLKFTISQFFLDLWWVKTIIIVVLLSLIAFAVRRRIQKINQENEKELELKNLQLNNQKLQLASLRGQMNPHFIFNVLNSIQKNILTGEKWQANNLLTRFSKLIRSSLEYSRTEEITIQKEIAFLENYLEIEKQRTPEKFNFELVSDLEPDQKECLIPTLLVQPICENAIKHAFENGKGLLKIAFNKLNENFLLITISDDGIGYFNVRSKPQQFRNSVGLEIVKSRLKLFTDQGVESSMKIEYLDQEKQVGTKVTLIIPCK